MARLLFANHASAIAGAELVLLDVVRSFAGASAFLFERGPLEAELAARDLDVTVSRWGHGDLSKVRRDSSPLRVLPLATRFSAVALELGRLARRHDVVYANSQKAFVLAALAAKVVRRPLVWHLHDIIDATHFGAAQRRLQVTLANGCAARVIVPSRAAADAFVAAGGRAALLEVVANGLDVPVDPRPRQALRADLGLPPGPMVGVFSRLAAWKGQHVLLEAMSELPSAQCIVVGDALFGERTYADSLRDLVAERGLADRVHFLGPRSDVPRLMQAVDAVAHPSVSPEPFGRTLVEAMLVGTPVVAARAGACPEILDEGRAGVLVAPGDPQALARALRDVLRGGDSVDGMVAVARARAGALYGVDAMRSRVSDVVAAVAARARP